MYLKMFQWDFAEFLAACWSCKHPLKIPRGLVGWFGTNDYSMVKVA